MNKDFQCLHCGATVSINQAMGTMHRNHCNQCLWSKHVDKKISGDRASTCQAGMEPIGITLKHEGKDKYGSEKLGDVMLVHKCTKCSSCVVNRIAADDPPETIMSILNTSQVLPQEIKSMLKEEGIQLVTIDKKQMVEERLYGKQSVSG